MEYAQGKYPVKHPSKYRGDHRNVIWRSSWELRIMRFLDSNPSVVWWASEELYLPYIDPTTNKPRRYFPDFIVCVKTKNGETQTFMLEIKPDAQTKLPPTPIRQTRKYLAEVLQFAVNRAKWQAAEEFCLDHGWTFKVITEKDIPSFTLSGKRS